MNSLEKILEMLHSPDSTKVISALQYLVRKPEFLTGDPVHETIRGCLQHADVAVRFWAHKLTDRQSLAASDPKPPATVVTNSETDLSGLLERLQQAPSGFSVIELLRKILNCRKAEARAPLLAYLEKVRDPVHLSFLTKHLGLAFPDDEMLTHLIPFLQHSDDRVVANTVEGIEPIISSAAVAVLAQLLNHASQRVRANAAKALSHHDPEAAAAVLLQMLQMREHPNFVLAACYAVRQVRGREFLPILAGLLKDPMICTEAMNSLSAICGDIAIGVLDQLPEISKDSFLRQRVLMAIEDHIVTCQPPNQNPWAPLQPGENRRSFDVGEKKIFALKPALTMEEARKKAMAGKLNAFGLISKFLYRPTDDQIRLTYSEMRFEPFWHVVCQLHLDFTRAREVDLNFDRPVQAVRVGRQIHSPDQGKVRLSLDEHCIEECLREVYVDAQNGSHSPFQRHVTCPKQEIQQTEELMVDDVIVVPARIKASPVVRDLLSEMMKPVKATEINSERISLHRVNLVFRPVYAFEFQWEASQSFSVLEIDGVTGELISGKALKKKFEELISESSLFELGSDAVDLVLPGSGLAAKIARAVLGKN